MLRKLLASVVVVLAGLSVAPAPAEAYQYIVYLQGRGWKSWNGQLASVSGWTNVTLSFDGNRPLLDTSSSTVNTQVKNALTTYCAGSNTCVVHCYSAGCLRLLKAVSDITSNDYRNFASRLPGFLWAEGSGAAAGGTRLAEMSTTGGTGFLAKLIGQQEKIDFDLTIAKARGTYLPVQDDMNVYLYHVAGRTNLCKSLVFFKICGNTWVLPSGVSGTYGDGVIGFDSSSGASSAYPASGSAYWDCNVAKYPARDWERDVNFTPALYCAGGADRDHFGIPTTGSNAVGAALAGSSQGEYRYWSDAGLPSGHCTGTDCDRAFSSSTANWSKKVDGTIVATTVETLASNTTGSTAGATCGGKCGGNAKSTTGTVLCGCSTSSTNKCSDYLSARCDVVNAQ